MFRTVKSCLSILLLVLALGACSRHGSPTPETTLPAYEVGLRDVLASVSNAPAVKALPADVTPALASAVGDLGFDNNKCETPPAADHIENPCVYGDPASQVKLVLWGDSHAGMWVPALSEIASRHHWRLTLYGKPACPTADITFWNQQEGRVFTECDRWRSWVETQIRVAKPALVIMTNESFAQKVGPGELITPQQWQDGMTRTLDAVRRTGAQMFVIGDTPVLDQDAPQCLAAHRKDIARCNTSRDDATARIWNDADAAAAAATDSGYVSVVPWLCGTVCTPVIGNVIVYRNRYHLTATYSRMMNAVLDDALQNAGFSGGGGA